MSALAEKARVSVLLADYASADAIGKINVLGAGFALCGIDVQTGAIPPQTLVVLIDILPEFYGEDFTLSVALRDSSGNPVEIPGPAGAPQPMRVAQVIRAETPVFPPGTNVPKDVVWAHAQLCLQLMNGLPLKAGDYYTWSVQLDGTDREDWAVSFYVAGPPPPVVLG